MLSPGSQNITVATKPWPNTEVATGRAGGSFGSTILIGMSILYPPAGMALTLVAERQVRGNIIQTLDQMSIRYSVLEL